MRVKLQFSLVALLAFLFFSVAVQGQIVFDKPKEIVPLDNPYTLNLPRADVIKGAQEVLQSCKIDMDVDNTKVDKGRFVTKPWIFSRGLTVRTDLEYVSRLPADYPRNWLKGRYYLEVVVLPLDDKRSQLQVIAHIQGQVADATGTKWIDAPSSGRIEDEVLRGLGGKVLGLDLSPKPDMKRRLMNCEY